MVRRYNCLVERVWARGWDIYVASATRSESYQRQMYAEWQAGKYPNIVANPDRIYGTAPAELGGWTARGSMHMPQADGWSHALDIGWSANAQPRIIHDLAYTCGLRFPEPTENWHMEFWSPWPVGVYPITDPRAEGDMNKYEHAAAIGAVIPEAPHPYAGMICTPALERVVRDEHGNIIEQIMGLYPVANVETWTHQELKLARLQQPGNTELS
jgi:hypothetical protein